MSGVLTPLELAENQACEAIARGVACEHSPADPQSPEALAIRVADEIADRIAARATSRTLAPDPFRRCAYPGCDDECIGPFCKAHARDVPLDLMRELSSAITRDDQTAYGFAIRRAIAVLTGPTVPV